MSITAPAVARDAAEAASGPAPDTRLHPLVALRAMRRLLGDPEDTRQVFVIVKALRGRSGLRLFERFQASPTGARILAQRPSLLAHLSDDAALAAMAPGSLGRDYKSFMDEESLSAAGLVDASSAQHDASPLSPDQMLLRERMRDTHDLMHVLTGYGRDPLGELCVLAFTYTQTHNRGLLLIIGLGALRIRRQSGRRDVFAAVGEAFRRGRALKAWLPSQLWEALLPRPVAALQAEFGIVPHRRYTPVVA